jgi:hypothetical protein
MVFIYRKRVVGHLDTVGLLDSENSMAIEWLDSLTFAGNALQSLSYRFGVMEFLALATLPSV